MLKVTTTIFFLVTFLLNSFFLASGNGFTILKFKKLCTCNHSTVVHTEEDHSSDPSKPHFCPRHKTTQKVESHFVVYPFHLVSISNEFHLTYDVLFSVKPYPYPLLDSHPTKLLRPPKA